MAATISLADDLAAVAHAAVAAATTTIMILVLYYTCSYSYDSYSIVVYFREVTCLVSKI